MSMSTPTLDKFLAAISDFLRSRNVIQLRDYLLVEPPLPAIYSTLISELHQEYPEARNDALEQKCTDLLPERENGVGSTDNNNSSSGGGSWPGFIAFMKEYLIYLRDVYFENLLETHTLLSNLVK